MSNKELIEKKFKDLIAEGRQILQVNGYEGRGRFNTFPSEEDYLRFRTEAANLVRRVCGDDSEHYLELRRQVGKFGPTATFFLTVWQSSKRRGRILKEGSSLIYGILSGRS